MGKLTMDSTIKDVQELLRENDTWLMSQINFLIRDKGTQEIIGKNYLPRNFYFFMALICQGIDMSKEHCQEFNKVAYPDEEKSTHNNPAAWIRNAGKFVTGKSETRLELNEKLFEISEKTKLKVFENGDWYELKDQNGEPIFYDSKGKKSKFIDGKDENNNSVSGETRAKEAMKQIVKALVYGITPTSKGEVSEMTDLYKLLLSNKQMILNGAPGTGKTFSARNEIADKLFGIQDSKTDEKENIKKIQMDMVQFHPSYDYTDFIEGIRPTLSGQNVGYTLKNGSFKRFCRRAGVIERILAAGKELKDKNIEVFLEGEDEEIKDFWKEYIKKPENAFWEKESEKAEPDFENLPKFLFIIDEINRAEISKVLGEIMFCLDVDYRGAKGQIATQYASLATAESFFIHKENDKFFIPSNVYIIGTMNDIDRSVEVFDFALRRRFAWHEITAKDVMDKVLTEMDLKIKLGKDYENYLSRIEDLNAEIDKTLKLNRHYHLGPSYFAKIKLYMNHGYNVAREEVWNNHISQILNEYVKGKRAEAEIDNIGIRFKS